MSSDCWCTSVMHEMHFHRSLEMSAGHVNFDEFVDFVYAIVSWNAYITKVEVE